MAYTLIQNGESFSFPEPHAFTQATDPHANASVFIGTDAGKAYAAQAAALTAQTFVAIELDVECLGVHTGEDTGPSNVVGFARFRLGDDAPTNLVELVKKTFTDPLAVQAAKSAFEAAGFKVAVCNDFPGRILNRLIRPYYNAALRRLDEQLATADDMDKTLCLGLGYPEGPITLLNRSGLHHHYRVSKALYEALGQEPYAPARRAQVAWARRQEGQ